LIIKELAATVKILHIFSDNVASQFKNKYIYAALLVLKGNQNLEISWNFFAAQHGKGAVNRVKSE
jgi:hypothetical protein